MGVARVLLVFCFLIIQLSHIISKPNEFRLGALFPVFKTSKNDPPLAYDSGGHNRFAGMYLAVKELNNKTDGYHDRFLPDTNITIVFEDSKRDAGEAFFQAFHETMPSEGILGVHAIIGAASSGPTANAQLVCAEAEIPQISYSASSPSLANDVEYPFFARTVASDDFQANVIVDLIFNHFGWDTIATIAGTDLYSVTGIEAVQNSAFVEGLEILASKSFVTGQDFSTELLELKDSGARIIVVFAQAADGLEIIAEAYHLGVFGVDTGFVWVFSDAMLNSDFETLVDLYGDDLVGSFYVQSAQPEGDIYKGYLERLRSVPSKLGDCDVAEMSVDECDCDPETDARGDFLWIRDHDVDPETPGKCVGIDFENDAVNTYNPYAYDATILVAKAAHALIESYPATDELDTKMLFEYLVNVSYEGVTGYIDLGNSAELNQKGERMTGLKYDVINFISVEIGVDLIGQWVPDEGYIELPDVVVAFPTSDNSQPLSKILPECKVGEVLPAGSLVCLECEYGSFSKVAGESSCHDCPDGAVCHGGSHVKALRGYWRFPDSNGRCESEYDGCSLIECNVEEACEGDILLSTQSTLFLDSTDVRLGKSIGDDEMNLLLDFCFWEESYSSNCSIIVQGHRFALANLPNAINNDEKIITLQSPHIITSIGHLLDAEVYLQRPEECGEGYQGNRCAQCDVAGKYGSQLGISCAKCPDSLVGTYFVALAGIMIIAAIALLAIRMKLNRHDQATNKLTVVIKIFMSWGQLTTFFLGLSLNWPFSVENILEKEALIFNLGEHLISVDCIFNQYANTNNETGSESQVYQKIGFFLCLPIALGLVTISFWAILDVCRVAKIRHHTWDSDYFRKVGLEKEIADGVIDQNEIKNTLEKLNQRCDRIRVLEVIRLSKLTEKESIQVESFQQTYIKVMHAIHFGDAIMTNTIILFLLYPSVSLFCFRIFTCIELDDGKYFLEDDLSVQCYTSEHRKFALGIGCPAVLLYVVGIPILMMYMVFKERNSLGSPHNMLRIGFLYEGYAGPYWWWEGWVALRKIGAVILIVFTSQIGAQSAAILIHGLLLIALIAQLQCQPFGAVDRDKTFGAVNEEKDDGDNLSVYQRSISMYSPYNYKRYNDLNRLETLSLVSSYVSLSCGLMFRGEEISSRGLDVFMYLLFITNFCFIFYALKLGCREAYSQVKKYLPKVGGRMKPANRIEPEKFGNMEDMK
mmetsp:Transcript_31739/g.40745  ORF Transcript_31739/g.40745 Transcript_31739/m.40745 type:complete len:1210 (-) Transcript_31739:340-3969(-)